MSEEEPKMINEREQKLFIQEVVSAFYPIGKSFEQPERDIVTFDDSESNGFLHNLSNRFTELFYRIESYFMAPEAAEAQADIEAIFNKIETLIQEAHHLVDKYNGYKFAPNINNVKLALMKFVKHAGSIEEMYESAYSNNNPEHINQFVQLHIQQMISARDEILASSVVADLVNTMKEED